MYPLGRSLGNFIAIFETHEGRHLWHFGAKVAQYFVRNWKIFYGSVANHATIVDDIICHSGWIIFSLIELEAVQHLASFTWVDSQRLEWKESPTHFVTAIVICFICTDATVQESVFVVQYKLYTFSVLHHEYFDIIQQYCLFI